MEHDYRGDELKYRAREMAEVFYQRWKMRQVFKLNKEELGNAIVRQVGLMQGFSFNPFKVVSVDHEFPEELTVEIEFIPKGSTSEEGRHIFEVKK